MFDLFLKVMSALHTAILRAFKGRVLGNFGAAPVLLLTTRGRKSGKSRTVPLLYLRDGDRFIVIASKGGAPEHPDWYFNLEATPNATVQIGERSMPVTAQTLSGPERERLWREATRLYPGYRDYERKTTRTIPVVALTAA